MAAWVSVSVCVAMGVTKTDRDYKTIVQSILFGSR